MPPLSPAQKHPHGRLAGYPAAALPSCPDVHKMTSCTDNQLPGYLY